MRVEVVLRPEANEDLRTLGSASAKLEAAMYLVKLETHPWEGKPLQYFATVGDLSDCFKLYIDERLHRIVYRLLPNTRRPQGVDVIAIGPRAEREVYKVAVARLGRA